MTILTTTKSGERKNMLTLNKGEMKDLLEEAKKEWSNGANEIEKVLLNKETTGS